VLTSGATDLSNTVSESAISFHVTGVGTNQVYSDGQSTDVVQFNTTNLDSHSYWDGTNHRYTPQVSGWYWLGGSVRFTTGTTDEGYVAVDIIKNGTSFTTDSLYSQFQVTNGEITNAMLPCSSGLVYLNGSSDYVNVTFRATTACTLNPSGNNIVSHFSGFLVRAA